MKPNDFEQSETPPDADTMWVSEADEASLVVPDKPTPPIVLTDAEAEPNLLDAKRIDDWSAAAVEFVSVGDEQGDALELFPAEEVAHDRSHGDARNAALVWEQWTTAKTAGTDPAIEAQTAALVVATRHARRRPAVALRYFGLASLTLLPVAFFVAGRDVIDRGRELMTTAPEVTVQTGPPSAAPLAAPNTPDTLDARRPAWLLPALAVPPVLPVQAASGTPEAASLASGEYLVAPKTVAEGRAVKAIAAGDVPRSPPVAAALPSETLSPPLAASFTAPAAVVAISEPVPVLPSAPASSAGGDATVVPPTPRTPAATAEIQMTLTRYRRAFSVLDADAVTEVWPTADSGNLRRAFRGLQEQDVSFDNCDVRIAGDSAEAMCQGSVRYVQKVGSKTPRVYRGQWRFDLRHLADEWVIAKVDSK